MRAVIEIVLVQPTYLGKKVVTKKIRASKEKIVDAANQFIIDRVNDDRYIRAKEFIVSIYDEKFRRRKSQWSYKPTYRD